MVGRISDGGSESFWGSESLVALFLSVFSYAWKRTGGRFGPQQGAG